MSKMVELKDVTLRFDATEKTVLTNINLTINQGESVLLLGPSGSGKSSLIFCINGLYPRDLDGSLSGNIIINGKAAAGYAPGEINQFIGTVFQDPETQFCMMTVAEEIAFGLENIRFPSEKMDNEIDRVLALVKLTAYKHASIQQLSGGQKQKLALACVLAQRPKVLLLDEPTANLDPSSAKEFASIIEHLQQTECLSILVIEHRIDQWLQLADRCMLLNQEGKCFYEGPAERAINNHFHTLKKQGIWIPKAALLAEELGYNDSQPPFPLSLSSFPSYPNLPAPKDPPAPTDEEMLRMEHVSWEKNGKVIVDIEQLLLHKSEFVVIAGSNGSGKTSLSRLMAKLQKASSGTIHFLRKPLSQWKERQFFNKVGYVFQNPEHQFVTATVAEELHFSAADNQAAEELLKRCGLEPFKTHHPFELSHGQKRRLSAATAFVNQKELLILDEPTFGQDAATTKALMDLIKAQQLNGTTIVMISHDMDLIYEYASRVIVMNEGKIVFDDTPSSLWKFSEAELAAFALALPAKAAYRKLAQGERAHAAT